VNDVTVVQIGLQAMIAAAKLAAPTLMTALFVGLAIGLLQSVTQLQESTLAFVPKFAAVGVVLILSGSWMLNELVAFTRDLFSMIPALTGT
jgi:flagellar biosynthetic protein FliQ